MPTSRTSLGRHALPRPVRPACLAVGRQMPPRVAAHARRARRSSSGTCADARPRAHPPVAVAARADGAPKAAPPGRPAVLDPILDRRARRREPHEPLPRPSVRRPQPLGRREAARHRHEPIGEVIALQLAADRAPVPPQHPRHPGGRDPRTPPAFDLPSPPGARMRAGPLHGSSLRGSTGRGRSTAALQGGACPSSPSNRRRDGNRHAQHGPCFRRAEGPFTSPRAQLGSKPAEAAPKRLLVSHSRP